MIYFNLNLCIKFTYPKFQNVDTKLAHLDLYMGLSVISRPEVGEVVTCLESGGGVGSGVVLAGCKDGTVRIMDGGLRSNKRRYEQKVRRNFTCSLGSSALRSNFSNSSLSF